MKNTSFWRACGAFFVRCVKRLWSWLHHNFGMKVAAIVFAFVLWNYVLVATNPLRDKTLTNLPVQLSNVELLRERSLALVEDVASSVRVRVTVQANNERLVYITQDNVSVSAELSGVTKEGMYRLELSAVTQYGTVQKISPSYIDVNVEQLVTRIVPIRADVPVAAEEQWASSVYLYPENVTVTGAASLVESVSHAQVTLDKESVAENVVETLPLTLVNAQNSALNSFVRADAATVVLTMHYYPIAQVPVELVSNVSAAQGYSLESLRLINDTVTVAAPSHLLGEIRSVQTQPVAATDLRENTTMEAQIIVPQGAAYIHPAVVKVRANVEQQTVQNVGGVGGSTLTQ